MMGNSTSGARQNNAQDIEIIICYKMTSFNNKRFKKKPYKKLLLHQFTNQMRRKKIYLWVTKLE